MAVADDIRKSVGYASVGFGAAAVLTPRLFLGIYGVPNDQNVRLMTRIRVPAPLFWDRSRSRSVTLRTTHVEPRPPR